MVKFILVLSLSLPALAMAVDGAATLGESLKTKIERYGQ